MELLPLNGSHFRIPIWAFDFIRHLVFQNQWLSDASLSVRELFECYGTPARGKDDDDTFVGPKVSKGLDRSGQIAVGRHEGIDVGRMSVRLERGYETCADAHRISKARPLDRYRDLRERLRASLSAEAAEAAEAQGAALSLQAGLDLAEGALGNA